MAITKPPVLPSWAESGDKVTPSNAEIQVGWPLSSIPPSRQRFNWLLNFLANGIRYFSRRGLPDYDAAETYMTGDRIIGDDGKTYRSLIDNNTAQTPSTSPTKWEEWAPTLSRFAALIQGQTYTAFTTAGAAPNFTLTPSPAIAAYAAGQRFRVKFHAPGSGADVLNISALGNKSLKQYDSTGAKVAAVIAANQLVDVEYDGVDLLLLDPLPPVAGVTSVNGNTGNVSVPEPSIRQTVLGGPVDTSGLPTFLPATSASLSITSQNIAAGAPFVVAAANGFNSTGALDRIGISTANLTWSGLAANSTNYLYVDVAANGTLTPGSTTVAPIYQNGGTPAVTANQATFNIAQMQMFVGNGSTAPQTYRVFVGEAVTNASTVTSTVAYAYQGKYDTGWFAVSQSSAYSKNHNIGVVDLDTTTWANSTATDVGKYRADTSGGYTGSVSISSGIFNGIDSRNGMTFYTGGGPIFTVYRGASGNITIASGYCRAIVKRSW